MNHLKNFKQHIHQITPMKETELKYYKQFADFLQKYEEGNEKEKQSAMTPQVKSQDEFGHVRLVSGDTKAHLKNKLDVLAKELQNPFIHIRNWVKGEMMNLECLMQAIGEKESCDVRKQMTIKKLAQDRELNNKIGQGKFAFKTVFKSKSGKAR